MASLIRVQEPRTAVKAESEATQVVLQGSLRSTAQTFPADSSQVGSKPQNSSWSVFAPSDNTIVDRYILVRHFLDITTDADLELGTNDCLRQFPMSSVTATTTMTINGTTFSDNTAGHLHPLLCYGNTPEDRVKAWSMSPAQPDQYMAYADWATLGSARNVAAKYGENSTEMSRGGFEVEVVGPRNIRVVVTEPLWLSPFLDGTHESEGMVNVNQLNLSLRYDSNFARVLSHSALGQAITTVDVTFYRQPEVIINFLTPDLLKPMPERQVLPYHKPQDYIKSVANLTSGATATIFSDSLKLSQVPNRVYLVCKRSRATETFATTDSFLNINNISVLWNNESGLLSSATEQELYRMSVSNGCNLSWPQWHTYRGSVACIQFGKDIGLLDSLAPGVQGSFSLQVQMTVKNIAGDDFQAEFYMIPEFVGAAVVVPNSCIATLGNLTSQDVLSAREAPELHHADYATLAGGSFFGSLKNIVRKIASGVEGAAGVAQSVGSPFLSPQVLQVLKDVQGVSGQVKTAAGGRRIGGSMAEEGYGSMRRRRR